MTLTDRAVCSLKGSRMEWSDEEAAERARAGDTDAFRMLVERHGRALFRLAYRMTGNEQDAEDLAQETLLRAFRQLHRFDGRASFATWVYRICANCSLDLIRARKHRGERCGDDKPDWMDHLASSEPSPERVAQSVQMQALLGPAMQQLSDMERTAFVLRHFEGCAIPEIASALGVEGGAAKHTVFRAVQKLRRALEPVLGAAR